MVELRFTVPGSPVPKARARVVQTKFGVRSFTPETTVEFEHRVMAYATQAKAGKPWPLDGLFRLHADVYRDVQRGDWDNYGKAVADALQGVLWRNDAMVHDGRVRVHLDRKNPRTVVRVWRLEAP